jgi:hypothetical protein
MAYPINPTNGQQVTLPDGSKIQYDSTIGGWNIVPTPPTDVARALEALSGTDRLSVTNLKDLDQIASGGLVGNINFGGTLTQFNNAQRNQYWKAGAVGTIGGVTFAIGDKLVCVANVTGTPPNLTNAAFWAVEANYQIIASTSVVGAIKVGAGLAVTGLGTLSSVASPTQTTVVANQAARLAIPTSALAKSAIQTDTNIIYYINGGDDPSISGNWINGGSVAASVQSFKARTGVVVPAFEDYTLELVPQTDITTSLKYKLVIDNGVLFLEEL